MLIAGVKYSWAIVVFTERVNVGWMRVTRNELKDECNCIWSNPRTFRCFLVECVWVRVSALRTGAGSISIPEAKLQRFTYTSTVLRFVP